MQAQTQNTELVNYLLQLQYATQAYYDSMSLTYQDAREAVSSYLTRLNAAAVTEVSEGSCKFIEQSFKSSFEFKSSDDSKAFAFKKV